MKKLLLVFIAFFAILKLSYSQITHNPNYNPPGPNGAQDAIIVNGIQTGDDLRTFITANPGLNLGTVTDNNITFNATLVINNNAVFSDTNAVYHFPNTFLYNPRNASEVTLTDVVLHYSGNQRNHSFTQAYTANYNRVTFLQGVTSGRSDFFNNGNFTFNMNDVNFTSYGANDFLHFQTAETLNNITIVNAAGALNFEPGARNNGEVETIINLNLRGITRIVGGSGSRGDFRAINLDWDALNWNFSPRDVDFFFVNPIKPAGWTGYSGGGTLPVQEFYTHNVTVNDIGFNPLQNIRLQLYNDNDGSFDYILNTDANGEIPTQEVLYIDNTVSTNHVRGNSTLIVNEYLREYRAFPRVFNEPLVDIIISQEDENISETNQAIVAAYTGIAIDHNAQTLTISEDHTLCEVYDFIKLNKVNNPTEPNINEIFAKASVVGNVIDIENYQFVLSGAAVISPCDTFLKLESSATSNIADVNNLDVGLEDAAGLFKLLRFTNIVSADYTLDNLDTSTNLLNDTNFTGTVNYVTQLNSTQVRMLVNRDGYTNWSATIDLSGPQDLFVFEVFQAVFPNPATVENQDDIIYLAKKILMKNEGILKECNGTNPTLNIINNTQSATINATEERQLEALILLKRILAKTNAIRKSN